jgi:hypothetical protein
MMNFVPLRIRYEEKASGKLIRMPKPGSLPFSVESRILFLRKRRVILDSDLAALYGVTVKRFNEQVKRNRERFPADFMFRLGAKEQQILRSQIATSKSGSGGRRYAPYAFTEHGAIMARRTCCTPNAVQMSLFVVRAFVKVREMLGQIERLLRKLGTQRETRYT